MCIDFSELKKIGDILNIKDEELFNLWKNIFADYLEEGGFDTEANKALLDSCLTVQKSLRFLKNKVVIKES